MKYLPLLLLLLGCAKLPLGTIDPELQPYKDLFMEECSARIVNCGGVKYISLTFMPIERSNLLGSCYKEGNIRSITVSPARWKYLNAGGREQLVMHEYGHCFLDREHLDDKANGNPVSLLTTYQMDGAVYLANREYYLTELFAR